MDEPTLSSIKAIADLGGTVILTVMLYFVWQRLNIITDRLMSILEQLSAQSKDNET